MKAEVPHVSENRKTIGPIACQFGYEWLRKLAVLLAFAIVEQQVETRFREPKGAGAADATE
jgi:hypothetical protein